jgi:Lrp/AsnC family leucine-responsive transcriptional regulator
MTFQTERQLDETDWQVLKELQADGRLSFHELGRRQPSRSESVGSKRRVSSPATRRALIPREPDCRSRLSSRCAVRLDRCLLKTSQADDYPEVVEIHKLSGDYCSMLKIRAASIEHLEGVIERIGKHGEMRTSVVLSTQYADRPVEPPPAQFLRASASQGWASPKAAVSHRMA